MDSTTLGCTPLERNRSRSLSILMIQVELQKIFKRDQQPLLSFFCKQPDFLSRSSHFELLIMPYDRFMNYFSSKEQELENFFFNIASTLLLSDVNVKKQRCSTFFHACLNIHAYRAVALARSHNQYILNQHFEREAPS